MKHLGLFEGIGGFSLAARWIGWNTVAWVEINEFCQKVLKKNFPEAKGYGDIKEFDGSVYRGAIDIITGGFPCQPYSRAGKRKGNEDARHLWPEMLRVIGEIRPRWVVGENVPGLIDWSKGMVFKQIKTDLEAKGYQVFPPLVLPACGKEAPHERSRLWIIAYSGSDGQCRAQEITKGNNRRISKGMVERHEFDTLSDTGIITNTNGQGLPLRIQKQLGSIPDPAFKNIGSEPSRIHSTNDWREFPTQSPICRGDDGIPNRVDRIKSLGNAIVPQVAFEIFKAIEMMGSYNNSE